MSPSPSPSPSPSSSMSFVLFNLSLSMTYSNNLSNISLISSSSTSSSIISTILIGTSLSFIALLTAIGNIIVLLAFYYDRNLRTINDYFILNMAIADFLVGFFCIPFYIPFSLTDVWPFGRIFCKIWVTIDDVATMASVINIVAITINRYWSIAYPLSYRKYVRKHFVYLVMFIIWLISFLNFAPGIWLLNLFEKNFDENNEKLLIECSGDYNRSFIYMLIAQFNYFIWPFILLCFLNLLIMLNIWKRTRRMTRIKEKRTIRFDQQTIDVEIDDQQDLSILNENKLELNNQCQTNLIDRRNEQQSKNLSRIFSFSSSSQTKSFYRRNGNQFDRRKETNLDEQMESEMNSSKSVEKRSNHRSRQRDLRIHRDRRAARSLFILVLVFLIFLFPYVICATLSTAGISISSTLFNFSFWLLWFNSTFNPILYPFIQLKYRRAYFKLFESFKKKCSFNDDHLFF